MHREPFVMVCCSDFAGQVRGKGFPARDLPARWSQGIGWTPTNIMINCFGEIPATPWGALGDLILMPDPEGEVRVDFGDGGIGEHFILADILNMDGSPWACCPRTYLKEALEALRREHGLVLRVAFEHEFTLVDIAPRLGSAYGLEAVRQIGELPEVLLSALDRAGLAPETFLPEFSPGQFEFTLSPALALEAADRAVKARQLVRASALRCGGRATFSPILRAGGVGNGLHVHFSLEEPAGLPVSHDPDRPAGISAQAGFFLAGILEQGPRLPAITAASVISYERLRPNAWSTYVTNLGVRDREAFLRVCPGPEGPGSDKTSAFNFEYRAADSAASPYLVLGALVRAGIWGLEQNLTSREAILAAEAKDLPQDARAARGLRDLPKSLGEALDLLEEKGDILMPEALLSPYLLHKRGEIESAAGFEGEALFRSYAEIY